ncbi:mRNA splicing protein [Borealophlyctis nickersoniae]|nr:mRNA splicing protein [Borealophlyctis nickersoniae]
MATLFSSLPKPRQPSLNTSKWATSDDEDDDSFAKSSKKVPVRKGPPPYGQRDGYTPRTVEDYGDGGAFPEILIAQYPLDMGRKRDGSSNRVDHLPLQTDGEGNIRYDMILRQGDKDGKKIVHAQLKDMTEQDIVEGDELARPDEEAVKEITEKTRAALEKIVETRIRGSQPKKSAGSGPAGGPSFVRYTPANASAAHNSGASTRIIRMVEAPVDPMEPAKFKHKKVPKGPPSPPAPVMHSPPRKVTAEQQKDWVIPPCISNWKNAKGYTIPLDKRLAADGRGVQDIQINDNFAKLSEALFIADRHAREEVRIRAEMQSKLAAKEKRDKEEKLRMLAQKAREERAGLVSGGGGAAGVGARGAESDSESEAESEGGRDTIDEDERQKLKEREEIRRDRAKQREREIRLSHMGAETKARVLSKSGDRDISEKIALGLAQPTMSKESMFDSRLFNQDQGLASGFGAEDSYNLYDKPLFSGSSAASIYRPKRGGEEEAVQGVSSERIERLLGEGGPHRGFAGAEGGPSNGTRDGPVQFEKEAEADPFGFTEFMSSAKRGRAEKDSERRDRGTMHAAVAGKKEDYEGRSGRRRMEFESERGDDRDDRNGRDYKRSRRD